MKFGIFADSHIDFIHDGLSRVEKFYAAANEEKVDFYIQLGDFCSPCEEKLEIKKKAVEMVYTQPKKTYHVLGNHDNDHNSKSEVLRFIGQGAAYGSFDMGGVHFIYLDANYYDEDKYKSWENAEYQLVYIGTQEAVCGKTVLAGIYNQSDLIKKVIYRTLDESIVKLQKNYEVFRIKEPIYSIDSEGNVIAKIGLKEGISDNSKFEVIERIEASDGTIKYKRLGVIQPNPDKIWDNRYMAVEEGAVNADLEGTTFSVVSGHGFYPGLLIREIRF